MNTPEGDRKLPAIRQYNVRPLDYRKFVRTNDDIHTSINLCPVTTAFLSTPQMQRLRGLKQLGTVEHVYVNATHTRFDHSLGVMHLSERLCKSLQRRQPNLGISNKDVLCVKLAGLLHDIGHGPFSHIYDGVFVPAARSNEVSNSEDEWCHEDGSLMMIDAALKHLGMAVDLDRLDEPLNQVGDGIDAKAFGFSTAQELIIKRENIITSRDVIFIKECILGGPLSTFEKFVGRPKDKEFLYDIVSNRHCGLDVDKIDYYARDSRRTQQGSSEIEIMFIEEALVAKAVCSRPKKCFHCQHCGRPSLHLMICWPMKLVVKSMEFFKTRFAMHSKVYTHKTVKAVEYMICDVLRLSDPHIKIKSNKGYERISTAMNDASAYVNLRDSVIDTIELSAEEELKPAQSILQRIRSRDLYKCSVQQPVHDLAGEEVWLQSENQIKEGILGVDCQRFAEDGVTTIKISENDVIVEKRIIHHGLRESNPVSLMRYVPKHNLSEISDAQIRDLPIAKEVDEHYYESHIPRKMLEKTIRVYCRDADPKKVDLVRHAFYQWYHEQGKEAEMMTTISPCAKGKAIMLTQDESDDDDDDEEEDNDQNLVSSQLKIVASHGGFRKRKYLDSISPNVKDVARDFRSMIG